MKPFEKDYSLRERKQAKTKVILATTFLEILKNTKYENISIKNICEKAEISEGTFYNYFPQKTDLFHYVIGLFGKKKTLVTNEKVTIEDPIKWLEVYFDNVVDMMLELGDLSDEILSTIVRERVTPKRISITKLEFLYMFPKMKSNNAFKEQFSIEDSFDESAEKLAEKGMLKKTIKKQDVATALKLILGGVPLIKIVHDEKNIKEIVRKQFSIVLHGVIK